MDEVSDRYDPDAVEEAARTYWEETDAYEATKDAHSDDPDYYFLDGPPYTSGQMHLGTAWNKTLKDSVIRYLRMQGYDVHDQPGYDMHGLPIEVKVEEQLGFETKSDIEEHGVANFIDDCKEFAEDNLAAMNEDFQRMGVWMDWDDPYRTLDPEYMEGAWWAFRRAFDRGLVERGKRVINQCPRCETAIADAEVEYDQIESPSIYVTFPLLDDEDDAALVIWTTTPWTIPANLYVAVDEELEYSKVRATREGSSGEDATDTLIVASECLEDVLREGRYGDYEVLDEFTGDALVGERYEHPLLDEVPRQRELDDEDGVHEVHATDFVTAERTGLVHAAPGHGVDDFEFGEEAGLPVFSPVDTTGVYTDEAGDYAGAFVRDANPEVIADLDEAGHLLAEDTTHHRYGHCWRCDTPIVFVATDQWFVTVTDVKDRLLEELEESDWYPQWARDNRFRDWVENARDWNVSRQRYWGIPVPIWLCSEGHRTCVGTRDELRERALDELPPEDELDLHRPAVDEIAVECTECGEPAERVEDVFDVWLDSAAASWASIGYPGNAEPFESIWPAELIVEAHDQTRGWFWTQLGMSVTALDATPYERVVMHGHALDEDGLKMSKSRGNIVTPQEAIERTGVDPLRCFLLSHDQQGEDMRFSWDEIEDKQRTLNVLWNTYRFPLPYMRLDDVDPAALHDAAPGDGDAELGTVDRWVLSRLQSTKEAMDAAMDDYAVQDAQAALLDFVVEDVSRYYVQVVRPRMWREEDDPAKRAAYQALYTVLEQTTRLIAPFAPHLADEMHRNLAPVDGTVHARDWPAVDDDLHDPALEDRIAALRDVEEAGANARQRAERGLRWPVKRVVVETADGAVADAVDRHRELLRDRLNAREIRIVEDWDGAVETAEPEMDAIGPAFGEDSQRVMVAVQGATRDELGEPPTVALDGEEHELDDDMVSFHEETPEGWTSADFAEGSVHVDVSLDDDIRSEGYARELVRRVQQMRKDLELDVDERIRVAIDVADDEVAELAMRHEAMIADEIRADMITDDLEPDAERSWEVDGTEVAIGIELADGAAEPR